MQKHDKPQLGFISPMLGRHPGHIPTQAQFLSDQFIKEGYSVISSSNVLNRLKRFKDICQTIIQQHPKIDVLIVEIYGGLSFVVEDVASLLGQQFGKKIILHLHNGELPVFMAKHPSWVHRVFSRATAIVAPSPFLARAIQPYHFSAKIIPNLLDTSHYPFRQRGKIEPHLFWMRSFYPYYNPQLAIEVLSRLKSDYPMAKLIMAGKDKGLEQNVRHHAIQLGLQNNVIFPGFLDMPEKIRFGSMSDIFLNTNRVDNMPVSVIEACALGMPVVATEVGGIADMLTHEETALLVPDNDATAMTTAVRRLLKDTELVARLSRKGREFAERSSWTAIFPQWETLFSELTTSP